MTHATTDPCRPLKPLNFTPYVDTGLLLEPVCPELQLLPFSHERMRFSLSDFSR